MMLVLGGGLFNLNEINWRVTGCDSTDDGPADGGPELPCAWPKDNSGPNCPETAKLDTPQGEFVLVRSTRHRDVPPTVFTPGEWATLKADIISGRLT